MSRRTKQQKRSAEQAQQPATGKLDLAKLESWPVTYQDINGLVERYGAINPFDLRRETFLRIEKITGSPLICYVARTHGLLPGMTVHIEDSDLIGFDDLIQSTEGTSVDIFLISDGGVAETTERIVKLLRERFDRIRFLVAANAYSAATLMCLSGDEIIMEGTATLGPIDPQINGVPTRAILRAFEQVKDQLKKEGPSALTAYMPLISKYDLHMLEMCKSAEELSAELAKKWLSSYMLKCELDDPRILQIVSFFASYDTHKSHARGIDRSKAEELGLKVTRSEKVTGLSNLIRSLRNQYAFWFDRSAFCKMYENARGINWGRQAPLILQNKQP